MFNSHRFEKLLFASLSLIGAGVILWKSSCSTLGIVLSFALGGAMLGLYSLGRWVEENSS